MRGIHVASISGGRTSHFMIQELVNKYGKDKVRLVYCDTGAEHPETYTFIKDTARVFDMEITCLILDMPSETGKGGKYVEVPLEEIGPNYEAFKSLMDKYGRPYNPGGKFCTDQMKTQIFRKYCNDTYGKGNYWTWIGYRDEPKDSSRAWGHTLSGSLSKWFDTPQRDQGEFYKECWDLLCNASLGTLTDHVTSQFTKDPLTKSGLEKIQNVVRRVVQNYELGYRFLFEISDFDKTDILDWWEEQEFDLDIPNHTGNCVFCIEKTVNQLAYLCHTQPTIRDEWKLILDSGTIPEKEGRKEDQKAMYRNGPQKLTFDDVIAISRQHPEEYWLDKVGMEKRLSPCAGGSCDLYGAELDN